MCARGKYDYISHVATVDSCSVPPAILHGVKRETKRRTGSIPFTSAKNSANRFNFMLHPLLVQFSGFPSKRMTAFVRHNEGPPVVGNLTRVFHHYASVQGMGLPAHLLFRHSSLTSSCAHNIASSEGLALATRRGLRARNPLCNAVGSTPNLEESCAVNSHRANLTCCKISYSQIVMSRPSDRDETGGRMSISSLPCLNKGLCRRYDSDESFRCMYTACSR